ncbi:MAG: CoA transferase [Desulfarculaceae bacterium]|nr:CoA transferase [Desulfarculaceae bacterium]MCF8047869.1 CoA transferase [Desulfarculaceae bacterium]MCF8063993.1 CoA transferase [Desulfarculaceae bacterium]MCF8098039.1 CoA transferase [Desulfarculaceae bacterium]
MNREAANSAKTPGLLAGLRVVELMDNDASLGGKILADLGAEVLKIEDPRRDSARQKAPVVRGRGGESAGLAWISCNLGKQSLQLDLESDQGRHSLAGLLEVADVFLESTPPGHLSRLGLDFPGLRRANPGLVMVSVTPFGQDGPYSRFAGEDLVLWALGGMLFITGDEQRPPLGTSAPQAWRLAGAQSALAAMIALAHRRRTGQGQQVDLSVQACIPWVAQIAPDYWPCYGEVQSRGGTGWTIPSEIEPGGLRRTTLWPCRDGHVCAYIIAGGPAEKMNAALFRWMREEGFDPPGVEGVSWGYFGMRRLGQELIDSIEAKMAGFFLKLDKERLFREGQKRGVMVYPVTSLAEIMANEQLADRGYWSGVTLPDGRYAKVPNRWVHLERTPLGEAAPAPGMDEHDPGLPERWKRTECGGTAPEPEARQPFEGLLVADFSWAVAGPLTTRYLAEHGATVVRVESCDPKSMDIVRLVPPYYDDQPSMESAGLFHRLNVNKLSLGLDLGTPEGREVARQLALRADVVVENFRAGVMAKWGLDYESLRKENPGLLYLSSTNLGQTGPMSRYGGFGNLLTAYAGFYSLTGWPSGEPLPLPGAYTDYITPVLSAVALIAALGHREKTGQGQHLDVAQMECGLQMLGLPLLQEAALHRDWPRRGNRSPDACPHGVFPCAGQDRWCAIAVSDDQQWQVLQEVLGSPAALADEALATMAGRMACQESLERDLAEITAGWQAEQLMARLQERGVPAGLVANSKDIFKDPQLASRGLYQKVRHPLMGERWIMQSPALFGRTPQVMTRHAPCLGQDNLKVCTEILDMPLTLIDKLAASGAFGAQAETGRIAAVSSGLGES